MFAPADGPSGDAIADLPIEVGMKIRPTQNGFISALRFYKQANNTGSHVGHLWSSSGQQLAEAAFVDETASGWQQVALAQPVAVTANTTYVVSYHAAAGRFAWSPGYFGSEAGSGLLRAPSSAASGGNGVYHYGSSSGFPDESWNATNYWVDAVFSRGPPADTRPPEITGITPADGSGGVATSTTATVGLRRAHERRVAERADFRLVDDLGATVATSIGYDPATRKASASLPAPRWPSAHLHGHRQGRDGGVTDSTGNPLAADRVRASPPPRAPRAIVFTSVQGRSATPTRTRRSRSP